ncbi:hypothetical protein MM236_13575 [Belliella sp. DSM 107340]|uniref:Bacteriocin-type signal sequence n=1 Tax=Belliella calami TaxID=2923436 RepID=A0ABS9UQY4_9BACT|nr:ComC/BlpC family leader-containing pheromone/bacteriocin [Belliella calami]MCH7399029.1 hypothetical protein [Belliella calami]
MKKEQKMEKINIENFKNLSESELLQIEGGGLTEITAKIVECAGYCVGWLSSRKGATPAHLSALDGPNGRCTY